MFCIHPYGREAGDPQCGVRKGVCPFAGSGGRICSDKGSALSHLWEKFYKVDKARTREYGGSGVGLSIVKAIMESLNQKYGVENREDGVVFWFELDSAG